MKSKPKRRVPGHTTNRFVCPKCGSDEINELAICVVTHRVIEWSASGKPEDYAQAEVDWESDMPYSCLRGPGTKPVLTLECGHCAEQFRKAKRLGPRSAIKIPRLVARGAC